MTSPTPLYKECASCGGFGSVPDEPERGLTKGGEYRCRPCRDCNGDGFRVNTTPPNPTPDLGAKPTALREEFEEKVFLHRFLQSIGPSGPTMGVGMPLGVSKNCPHRGEFCRKDDAGNYLDPFVAGAWWSYSQLAEQRAEILEACKLQEAWWAFVTKEYITAADVLEFRQKWSVPVNVHSDPYVREVRRAAIAKAGGK